MKMQEKHLQLTYHRKHLDRKEIKVRNIFRCTFLPMSVSATETTCTSFQSRIALISVSRIASKSLQLAESLPGFVHF